MIVEKKLALNLLNEIKEELKKSAKDFESELIFIDESIYRLSMSEGNDVSLTFLFLTIIINAKLNGVNKASEILFNKITK